MIKEKKFWNDLQLCPEHDVRLLLKAFLGDHLVALPLLEINRQWTPHSTWTLRTGMANVNSHKPTNPHT